jgi:cell wall-associated NlpC family hydrolase
MRSNPDKYEKIAYNGTTDNMQPGDIMTAGTGGGAGAHLQIYVEINGEAKVANGGWKRTAWDEGETLDIVTE